MRERNRELWSVRHALGNIEFLAKGLVQVTFTRIYVERWVADSRDG